MLARKSIPQKSVKRYSFHTEKKKLYYIKLKVKQKFIKRIKITQRGNLWTNVISFSLKLRKGVHFSNILVAKQPVLYRTIKKLKLKY